MSASPAPTALLRAWSYRRQLLGRAAPGPAEALRRVVAVYSSHPTAPLSLLCRGRDFAAEQLSAMEQRREVLRLPAMRQSIFLVPTGSAPCLFAASRLPLEKHAWRLRFAGLDWDEYAALKQQLLALAAAPITASELRQAVQTEARLMTALRTMAYEGLVLRLGASARADNPCYVATASWLGQPLAEADPAQSLRWLAEAYLQGYGPARVEDFAWWSGTTLGRARAALGEAVDVGGGLLLPADQEAAFARVEPLDPETVDVLPKWDAYTMGFAPDGRRRLVDDEHLGKAYTVGGSGTSVDGLPLVLLGGRAIASWSHRIQGNRLLVAVSPFERLPLPPLLGERAFAEVGRLLGASAVEVGRAS